MRRWLAVLLLAGCSPARDDVRARTLAEPSRATPSVKAVPAPPGDPARGRELAVKFECNRCHDGAGDLPAVATERHCTRCHDDIETGRFGAGTPKIGHWKQ